MESYAGVPVSPGIAIGEVFLLETRRRSLPDRPIAPADVKTEFARLAEAVAAAQAEIEDLKRRAGLPDDIAAIFSTHDMLLADATLRLEIEKSVRERLVPVENAVAHVFDSLVAKFKSLGEDYFAQRAADLRDVEERLLRALVGERTEALSRLRRGVIVVAHELSPSQTALLDRRRTLGFVTDVGGPTSHTAIIARGIGMPAVVGLGDVTSKIPDGALAVVDGTKGVVVVDPDRATLAKYQQLAKGYERYRAELAKIRDYPAQTLDGHGVRLLGNIESPDEVQSVLDAGGDGVGLFRTEFLYEEGRPAPDEQAHFEAYVAALQRLGGRPLTIRTLDFGADKVTPDGAAAREPNPFLGSRSIRLCLEQPQLFLPQLRAILRASAHGNVRCLFPMISGLDELKRTKELLEKARASLRAEGAFVGEGLPIGVMVEIPSAAIIADSLADEVDFFSIGSNDLIQYALAVDRGNERVAHLYQPVHPAILRLIRDVVEVASDRGKGVSLCGEMAGDMLYTVLLLGMGLRELSLAPRAIPEIKKAIRGITVEESREAAEWCAAARDVQDVQSRLRDIMGSLLPRVF
jgi:phosphoenolpyruvate-protein phosphotransferase (PTS system enzyme I)